MATSSSRSSSQQASGPSFFPHPTSKQAERKSYRSPAITGRLAIKVTRYNGIYISFCFYRFAITLGSETPHLQQLVLPPPRRGECLLKEASNPKLETKKFVLSSGSSCDLSAPVCVSFLTFFHVRYRANNCSGRLMAVAVL